MKAQELVISCFYDNDGESIRDLLYSSFDAFLKRELGKFAARTGASCMIDGMNGRLSQEVRVCIKR